MKPILKKIAIAIIIVLIIVYIVRRRKLNAEKMYSKTVGDIYDKSAEGALNFAKSSIQGGNNIFDQFIAGNINRYNKKDHTAAEKHYTQCIVLMDKINSKLDWKRCITDTGHNINNVIHIIDKIEDYSQRTQAATDDTYTSETKTRYSYLNPLQKKAPPKSRVLTEMMPSIFGSNNSNNSNAQKFLETVNYQILRQKMYSLSNTGPSLLGINSTNTTHLKITNDPQNVHDRQVNKDINKCYERILEYNSLELGRPMSPNEINQAFAQFSRLAASAKSPKAKYLPNLLSTIDKNLYVRQVKAYEKEIFANVWFRVNSRSNRKSTKELQQAFLDAMLACIEMSPNQSSQVVLVCADGRVSQIIGCLVFLDNDPSLGIIKTREVLRTEIFDKAGTIVKESMNHIKNTDPLLYKQFSEGSESDRCKVMEQTIKTKIGQVLLKEYKGVIPERDLAFLIEECKQNAF